MFVYLYHIFFLWLNLISLFTRKRKKNQNIVLKIKKVKNSKVISNDSKLLKENSNFHRFYCHFLNCEASVYTGAPSSFNQSNFKLVQFTQFFWLHSLRSLQNHSQTSLIPLYIYSFIPNSIYYMHPKNAIPSKILGILWSDKNRVIKQGSIVCMI